ncbi:hypothetical protein BDW22DRAFT_620788 [Trametopsis cervina]|nr:hypothetical protein BDW22DRAFT_620788 [Trametopsis cervina]
MIFFGEFSQWVWLGAGLTIAEGLFLCVEYCIFVRTLRYVWRNTLISHGGRKVFGQVVVQ